VWVLGFVGIGDGWAYEGGGVGGVQMLMMGW